MGSGGSGSSEAGARHCRSPARNGAAGALEEDARLTALFLWTLQSTGEDLDNGITSGPDEDDEAPQGKVSGFSLPFDVARRFAQHWASTWKIGKPE